MDYENLGTLMTEAYEGWLGCCPRTILKHLRQNDLGKWLLTTARSAQNLIYRISDNDAVRANFWLDLKYQTLLPSSTESMSKAERNELKMLLKKYNPHILILNALEEADLGYGHNPEMPETYEEGEAKIQ